MFDALLDTSALVETHGRLEIRALSDRAVYWLGVVTGYEPAMLEPMPIDIRQAAQLHGLGLRFH